jgi:hypothetical protein
MIATRRARRRAHGIAAVMRAASLLALGLGVAASSGGCRKTPPSDGEATPSAAEAELASIVSAGGAPSPGANDAASPVDPACRGSEIDLAGALGDARCAITSSVARAMTAALPAPHPERKPLLRQEASREDDGRVRLRLINASDAPVALPLSWHRTLPAFSALVEDAEHAVYELEPPRLEVETGEGAGGPRFARVVLSPGGAAVARVAIRDAVVRRVDGPCADAAPCASKHLPPGTYVLYLGELVADVEAGAPARLPWTIP